MKKILTLFMICFTIFIAAACMKTEKTSSSDTSSKNPPSQSYGVEQFDFSDTHITGSLAENLFLDAEITPADMYNKKLMQYHIKNAVPIEPSGEEYIQAINECYGTNIEILPEMYQTEDFLVSDHAYYDPSNFCTYKSAKAEDKYLLMETLFSQYPIYARLEDTKIINNELEKFKNYFQKFTDYQFSDHYICIHTNTDFYKNVKEMAQLANTDITASIAELNGEELYFVRLFAEIESDFEILDVWNTYPIGSVNNMGEGISNTMGNMEILNRNYADLLFDQNGNMLGFHMTHQTKKGEPSREIDILSAKDMLEIVQKKYQGTNKNHSITIRNVTLMYGDIIEKNTESNSAEAYLSPVWVIQYHRKGDKNYTTEVYLAETGELLCFRS